MYIWNVRARMEYFALRLSFSVTVSPGANELK